MLAYVIGSNPELYDKNSKCKGLSKLDEYCEKPEFLLESSKKLTFTSTAPPTEAGNNFVDVVKKSGSSSLKKKSAFLCLGVLLSFLL